MERRTLPAIFLAMDTRTPTKRSEIMSAVHTKNTGPELVIRKWLFGLGYRYRLHRNNLPGRPDVVFPGRRKAVFVHGCFWHGHGCNKGQLPKSRLNYWKPKILANKARDKKTLRSLKKYGWSGFVIWQCELRNIDLRTRKVMTFLGRPYLDPTKHKAAIK
jgi:DNA mismatch endonuclease (patch repair protein)